MLDFILFRIIFVIVLASAGVWLRPQSEPLWSGALFGTAFGLVAIVLERRFARVSLKQTLGIAIGVTSGMLCAALVSVVLGQMATDNPAAIHFTRIAVLLVLVYFGAATGAAKGELLNPEALGGGSWERGGFLSEKCYGPVARGPGK